MRRRTLMLGLVAGLACDRGGPGVQGSGVAGGEDRAVEAFTRVVQRGAADLDIEVGAAQRVRVETDDNVLPLITTSTVDGTLQISSSRSYSAKTGVRVLIAAPALTGVTVAGSGGVQARGLAGERFAAAIEGSGDMKLAGAVDVLEVEIDGSGDVDARAVTAKRVRVRISGSGDVTVHASERLEAQINGSGSVRYAGGATEVVKEVNGSGKVEPL